MIDFYIEGQVKNQEVVRTYIANMIKTLGLGRLRKPYINVRFTNKCDAYGLCEVDREYAEITIERKCHITGEKMTFMEQMGTLAHEMVHARQFLRGQLSAEGAWKWKGRNAENFKYENQPWEKEAYKQEKVLFQCCFPWDQPFTN